MIQVKPKKLYYKLKSNFAVIFKKDQTLFNHLMLKHAIKVYKSNWIDHL